MATTAQYLGTGKRKTSVARVILRPGDGATWFNGRWGLRADYRFLIVKSSTDASAFFGQETRYGHRVYGGLVLNVR